MNYKIPLLPLDTDLEIKAVLKKTASARSALAEMKGAATSMPNQSILISTLSLQEAKDSSEIENIITTNDELYKSDNLARSFISLSAKEVYNYSNALLSGFRKVKKDGVISNNLIVEIQSAIVENSAGFRKLPGTVLLNELTGKEVYLPPQDAGEIQNLMNNLEKFMNEGNCNWDPLVKMAVIHHQFESIHPFYDGNGRTGRIINVLYLVKEELLSIPILYLSRFINQNKSEYYRQLQSVREKNTWLEWTLYMLDGVEKTSLQTIELIASIRQLMLSHKQKIKNELPKIYSQDLINNIFRHPYTKIDFVKNELEVSRLTATKYLEELCKIGILKKRKFKKDNYYINSKLYSLLSDVGLGTKK
jgi:Fic family protein